MIVQHVDAQEFIFFSPPGYNINRLLSRACQFRLQLAAYWREISPRGFKGGEKHLLQRECDIMNLNNF